MTSADSVEQTPKHVLWSHYSPGSAGARFYISATDDHYFDDAIQTKSSFFTDSKPKTIKQFIGTYENYNKLLLIGIKSEEYLSQFVSCCYHYVVSWSRSGIHVMSVGYYFTFIYFMEN